MSDTPPPTEPTEESRTSRLCWTFIPVGVLLLLTVVLATSRANLALFLWLNNALSHAGDFVWVNVTLFADALVVTSLMVIVFRKYPNALCAMLIATVITGPTVSRLKSFRDIPRPPRILDPSEFHLVGPDHAMRSFPSGHSTTAFVVVSVLVVLCARKAWARGVLIGVAVLLALSRVAVGIHWPADVAAGATFGWGAGILGVRITRFFPQCRSALATRLLGALVIAASIVLTFFYTSEYDGSVVLQRLVGVGCVGWGVRELVMTWRRPADAASAKPPNESAEAKS